MDKYNHRVDAFEGLIPDKIEEIGGIGYSDVVMYSILVK